MVKPTKDPLINSFDDDHCINCVSFIRDSCVCKNKQGESQDPKSKVCSQFKSVPKKDIVDVEEHERGKTIINASHVFERLRQASMFIELQPLMYDDTCKWWLWNFKTFSYELIDEVDILNAISRSMSLDTTNSKVRAEIINGLKQVGREKFRTIKPYEPSWIQFKNQIVDVKTGEKFESSAEYFVTNPIPWKLGESEKTPVMDSLFIEWVKKEGVQDESYVNTLYEMLCYATLSHQFLQRLFALIGNGSNGKGCFLKILTKFLGKTNICTTEMKTLTTVRFETSALYKKQACLMTEVDSYDMKNTNLLKQLTGEDPIRYEFKGKIAFQEESATTIFLATNSLPVTPDQSDGYYRRYLIVDFPNVFTVGRDIMAEIPDIEFNNLAKKCVRVCKELYENRKFTNEGSQKERMERYEERSNPLMKFIDVRCDEDPEEYVIFQDFHKEFTKYLKAHRLRTMTKIKVTRTLRDEGFQVKGRKALKDNGEELHTTCVYSLKLLIDDKTTTIHCKPLLSQLDSYERGNIKKECFSVVSSGYIDEKPEPLIEEIKENMEESV